MVGVEDMAIGDLIYEVYSLVPGMAIRPWSMQNSVVNLNGTLIQQETQSNWLGEQVQPSVYCSLNVKGMAIFINN